MSPRRFSVILWKEWVGLRPFCILLTLLFIIGLVLVQVTQFMDEEPIWTSFFPNSGFASLVTFVLCVIVSLGILTREKDEGNIHFLDGLPVSRSSIYIAKSLLAFGLIAAIDLLWTGESIIYEFLSRKSDSPPTPWRHIGVFSVLNLFVSAVFICILLPLSFLRLWSLLVLGLLAWILIILKGWNMPFVTWLDPFELIQPPSDIDEKWVIPWKHMIVLSVISILSWLLGLWIFTRQTGSKSILRHLRESCLAKLIVSGTVVSIVIIWISLFFWYAAQQYQSGAFEDMEPVDGEKIRSAPTGGKEIMTRETKKFTFVYRKQMEKRLAPLVKESDAIFEKVAAFLEAEESATSGKTIVDLSNPVGAHNAGQAYWKKIRMVLPPKKREDQAASILGHEVTHVLAERITDGRLEESFDATRWFHEGLASYVEFTEFRDPEDSDDYDHWVALSSSWNEIDFTELVRNSVLSAKRDPNLVYPAGMIWVEAAIDVYGKDCPANLLRAIGRPDGPRKIMGMERWRDACIAANYDLERIRGRFRSRMRELREEYKDTCAKYPEIKEATVERKEGWIVITPKLPRGWNKDLPKGSKLVCRVRPGDDGNPGRWRHCALDKNKTFRVSALDFLKPKISFQIGWITGGWVEQPVFGEWISKSAE